MDLNLINSHTGYCIHGYN